MTASDQPTVGVALIRWLRTEAAKNKKKRSEVTHGAHFVTRARKLNQAADFIETAMRTPASGPVEDDDRLAVAVEALERIASYKWPVIVGHTTTTSIGQATGEVYESKWPVPKEGVLGALESVKTIAAQTLALLTSGEAGE